MTAPNLISATYEVNLYLNDVLIGDIRKLAQNLRWARYRTNYGVDSISFTLNDVLFADWCIEHGTTLENMLKPLALSCRIVRDGIEVVGGFLATLPAYEPNKASANLSMQFDGWLNLLEGVYLYPTALQTKRANQFVEGWIDIANARSLAAGKGFGFTLQSATSLATIQRTYDNYKSIKEAITQMTDNVEGAGQFDVIFNPDKSYYITNNLGRWHRDFPLSYPTDLDEDSLSSIRAPEVQGIATSIITLGAGEVSSDPSKSTVVVAMATNSEAVAEFGYYEKMTQYSSVSRQNTLNNHAATDLHNASIVKWQPQVQILGIQVPPIDAPDGLWLGDYFYIRNTADQTGLTSGWFRVQSFSVTVAPTGAETVTPELERVDTGQGADSTAKDAQIDSLLMKMEQEVRDLKTMHNRPFGMIRYYKQSTTTQLASHVTWTVTFEDDAELPAFLTIAFGDESSQTGSIFEVIETTAGILTYSASFSSSPTIWNIVATSSSPFFLNVEATS